MSNRYPRRLVRRNREMLMNLRTNLVQIGASCLVSFVITRSVDTGLPWWTLLVPGGLFILAGSLISLFLSLTRNPKFHEL